GDYELRGALACAHNLPHAFGPHRAVGLKDTLHEGENDIRIPHVGHVLKIVKTSPRSETLRTHVRHHGLECLMSAVPHPVIQKEGDRFLTMCVDRSKESALDRVGAPCSLGAAR